MFNYKVQGHSEKLVHIIWVANSKDTFMIIRYDEDSLLLALNIVHFFSSVPIVDFEQENVS